MVTEVQKNHVTVNGLVAKPQRRFSLQIKSLLEKTKSHKSLLLDIPESRGAKLLICIRNDTPAESFQHLELKLSKQHYRKMVPKTYQKREEI
jgi:hypothetical protein